MLLLGGSGRLGVMLRAHWPAKDDLRVQSRSAGDGMLVFDPLDTDAVRKASDGARAIICLAGVTPQRAARTGEALSANADLAIAAVRASDGARVFTASSAAVYGATAGVHRETDEARPVSPYGLAKLEMEELALAAGQAGGVPVTALRIGNVAGADAILAGWHEGMQVDQFADGTTPARSYIGPLTLAHCMYALTRHDTVADVINVAAPGTVAMGDLLDAAGLAWLARPAPAEAIAKVALDVSLLERYVDFTAVDGTAAGIVAEWRKGTGK